ncbi:MAG: beta-ketoacyl-ACP synthase II [Methylacidiphilales bacterium]|nr:beta-ketoacyl-ACP synthase II [Candidatus Methylacidiphilales bacterium]
MSNKVRVVVTGLGCVSPLGQDYDTTWKNLISGKSGAKPITHFDASDIATKFCCPVVDYDISSFIDAKEARRNDPFIIHGICAAVQAIHESQLVADEISCHRIGVSIGSGIGGINFIEASHSLIESKSYRKITPFFIPGSITNMISGNISIRFNFKGPSFSIVSACTTGTHNIGNAMRLIQCGDADAMVVGGSECASTKLGIVGFGNARALSTRNDDPLTASRPFDVDRDGFVMGDGAAVIVIESLEFAQRRGAKILAELVGYGTSSDAYHITSPSENGEGPIRCMKNALIDAKITPEEINYINAHGTSTPAGDVIESKAIGSIFPSSIQVSSTKSMTGHLLGASGSIEAIFCILATINNIIPPTINVFNQDPDCKIDCVPNKARASEISYALSNSFGFGGTNGSLIFKKFT